MIKTFEEIIDENVKEGELYEKLKDKKVRCLACSHYCIIFENKRGICKVRVNKDGKLYVPYGYVAGLGNDPIEKKPLFHFLPGTNTMTFGMFGCNFHCPFCQNWLSSQVLKDERAGYMPYLISSDEIVELALKYNSSSVSSSYNEPAITIEWAKEIFKKAKEKGLKTAVISNGYFSKEAIDYILPYLDAYKVDLKSFNEKNYRILGAKLEHVLNSIKYANEKGLWIEIVTLLVPEFNDSEEEIRNIANFIKGINPHIPWHITRFHPDYKMYDREYTDSDSLLKAALIGKETGLLYIYIGNIYGGPLSKWESTYCPSCKNEIIKRRGFNVYNIKIKDGKCNFCSFEIKGVWN